MDRIRTLLGRGPLIATAIHDGHDLRPEVASLTALSGAERLREEDPYTARFTEVAPTRIIAEVSRFEFDLNRPLERAVYREPEDAWGLNLWSAPLPDELVARSRAQHESFYAQLHELLSRIESEHGGFVVLDMHSYNHRRGGPDAEFDDPELNPVVNLGTGTMDRERWAPLVDGFLSDLRACTIDGNPLDVRENVRFRGGELSRWVHEHFPKTGCSLAVEVKKVFMDEWTGRVDLELLDGFRDAIASAVPGLLAARSAHRG